jgi:glycosyltransferase involved in cell wall biosynthesis
VRVSLDARLAGHAGIGRFIEGLWGGLVETGTDVVAIVPPKGRGGWRQERDQAPGPVAQTGSRPFLPAEQVTMPRLLGRLGVDVHHSTHLTVPYLSRRPVVLTVHDLFPVHWPWHARSKAAWAYYRAAFPLAMRRAEVVVAVSAYTAREIQELLPVPESKLRVVDHGIDRTRWRPASAQEIAATLDRWHLRRPYVLYSGTAKRHKNLPLLGRAWNGRLPPLVLAGPTAEELGAAAPGLASQPHVTALGRVPTADLVALYSGAEAVVLPSLHESVGFVALEAMACETPLVSSDGGCLVETVGDGGLLLAPDDSEAWATGIDRVVSDRGFADNLVRLGRLRVGPRSWRAAADAYCAIYAELAG